MSGHSQLRDRYNLIKVAEASYDGILKENSHLFTYLLTLDEMMRKILLP